MNVPNQSTADSSDQAEGLDFVDETPSLLIYTGKIREQLLTFCGELPGVQIRYPVKVNPHQAVLETLVQMGHGFDVASLAELNAVLAAGADPRLVLFAAPIKAPSHIAAAADAGVAMFVADSIEEVTKLAQYAPGSQMLLRLSVSNSGSRFPLAGKFGAAPDEADALLSSAAQAGLLPVGVAFHVGSQAMDAEVWRAAIRQCAAILKAADTQAWTRCLLDIGGGFPIRYGTEVPPTIEAISSTIRQEVRSCLPLEVELMAEPGRFLVADAGVLICSVIGTAVRGTDRWVYLDAGTYNAVLEALPSQGLFHFPVRSSRLGDHAHDWIVAGPSCDSLDRLPGTYRLPDGLAIGDRVAIHTTGAYSIALASPFCGWPTPNVIAVVDRNTDSGSGSSPPGVGE